MNETYKELTKALHKANTESAMVEDELKAMRESFEAELSPKKETAKKLAEVAKEAKTRLTDYAVLAYESGTLEKDGPVSMKKMTTVKINQAKALEWAKVNMPVAIVESVDEKLLKSLADRNPEWATMSVDPKPFVATDLTKYIE